MECIVPCNTFHSPVIFDACVKASGGIRPLHLVETTVEAICREHPHARRVGLMSTTGTRNLRLYHNLLEAKGLEVVEVDVETQDELHRTIYDSERGIKAVGKTPWSVDRFAEYASQVVHDGGADVLILGCTEIPIVLESCTVPLVDPMVCGARELLRRAYPEKLRGESECEGGIVSAPQKKAPAVGLTPPLPEQLLREASEPEPSEKNTPSPGKPRAD